MKTFKKVVSLVSALAVTCAFAASAAPAITMGDITEASTEGAYTAAFTTSDVATDAQVTVLVYKLTESTGELTAVESAVLPLQTNITYVNQGAINDTSYVTMTADDAYTIAFALGAVDGDGTYKVLVGGTGVATAASGTFVVGEAAPTYVLGDADGDGEITVTDASYIARFLLGAVAIDEKYVSDVDLTAPTGELCRADADGDGALTVTDSSYVARYLLGAVAIDGYFVDGTAAE